MSGTASASVRVRDAAWRGNVEVAAVDRAELGRRADLGTR